MSIPNQAYEKPSMEDIGPANELAEQIITSRQSSEKGVSREQLGHLASEVAQHVEAQAARVASADLGLDTALADPHVSPELLAETKLEANVENRLTLNSVSLEALAKDTLSQVRDVETEVVMAEKEELRANAPVLGPGKFLGGHEGNAHLVELGGFGYAVQKTYDMESNPLAEEVRERRIHQERAVYVLDRAIRLGVVPVTIERVINERLASMQEFIEGAQTSNKVKPEQVPVSEMQKIVLLDLITTNWDRRTNPENLLVRLSEDGSGQDQVFAPDSGASAFNPRTAFASEIPQELTEQPLDANIVKLLHSFNNNPGKVTQLQADLTSLLGERTATLYILRIDGLSRSIDANGKVDSEKLRMNMQSNFEISELM